MPLVEANGININYEERGSGDPLILIMGLGADGPVWEEHVKEYEKHFRCILMDNRGVGKSDKPQGPYTSEIMAADTAGLMDALGIDKAHVAGISMGGIIAQQLAINYPEKVRSAVIIASWAKCDTYAVNVFENFKGLRKNADPDTWMETLQLWIFAAKFWSENEGALKDGQKEAIFNPGPQPQYGFDAQADACIGHDSRANLGKIKCPTLIVVGRDDIFTPLKFSEELHKGIEGSELMIFDHCGHAVHWEDLEKFNNSSAQFMLNH